jgi:ABC-type enterochelin transport system permease subunit
MAVNKTTAIIGMLAIGSAPFLGLGILAVVGRIWKPNLRSTLPWLRALRWTAWLVGMILVVTTVLGLHSDRLLFAFAGGLVTGSIGLGVVETWVKRHYAPELIPPESPDGYWPSPRDQ